MARISNTAALTLCLLAASPAIAFERSITFCNRTSDNVNVAIAADFEGQPGITSKGWTNTSACSCRTVLSANLRATQFFLYVKWMGTRGNILNNAKAWICVKHGSRFSFNGQNDSQAACENAGGSWDLYRFYDSGPNETKKVSLSRAGDCNLMGDT
ncbi:MAG: DUF1036 domain-containing protein [Rhizobiaceae bacterium]